MWSSEHLRILIRCAAVLGCSAFMDGPVHGAEWYRSGNDTSAFHSSSDADTTAVKRRVVVTGGSIVSGLRLGRPRFTVDDGHAPYAILRGQLGVEVFGLPFRLGFDWGSDVRSRGWRNDLSLELDSRVLTERGQRIAEDRLGITDRAIDSLDACRAALQRRLNGQRYRSEASSALSSGLTDTAFAQPMDLDTMLVENVDINGVRGPDLEFNDSLMTRIPDKDSLNEGIDGIMERIKELENKIDELKKQRDKMSISADLDRRNLEPGRSALRAESFNIGRVVPNRSVFLINGIALQGVSASFRKGTMRGYVDVGRSFDDEFLMRSRVPERLRELQGSVFFQDVGDLERRRLASVRLGPGDPDGTHVHVGLLRGVAVGSMNNGEGGRALTAQRTNHVVELSTGLRVAPGHVLSFVVARSLMRMEGIGSDQEPEASDLLANRDAQNQALQLGWTSHFERSRTQVELTGRMVDPYFQSLGLSFIRNASRSLNAQVAQPIGRRLRLRLGYRAEERSTDGGAGYNIIHRTRINGTFRVSKRFQLRGGYAPSWVRTQVADQPAGMNRNSITELGWTLRTSVKGGSLNWSCELMGYEWTHVQVAVEGHRAGTITSDFLLERGTLSMGVGASYFMTDAAQQEANEATVTGRLNARIGQKTRLLGQYTLSVTQPAGSGWTCGMERIVKNNWRVDLELVKLVEQEMISMETVGIDPDDAYSCELTIGYTW